MARLVYVGPFADGVEIPALDLTVARGVPFEVGDEGNAAALLAQPSNFQLADEAADERPAAAGEKER